MKLSPGLILIWIFRKNQNSIFGRKISSHQKVCDQSEWSLDEGCLIKKCLISGALTQTFVLSILLFWTKNSSYHQIQKVSAIFLYVVKRIRLFSERNSWKCAADWKWDFISPLPRHVMCKRLIRNKPKKIRNIF